MNVEQRVHALLDRAAEQWPSDIALESETHSVTFKELQSWALVSALWMREFGVQPGDRVVIDGDNSIETVACVFGVLALGACFCLVHPSIPTNRLAYVSDNADARLTVRVRRGWMETEQADTPWSPAQAVLADNGGVTRMTLTDLVPDVIPEDLACLIYTSGSTGRPKGVTCLHRHVTFSVSAIASSLDYQKDDRIFTVLPLSFDYGLYQVFLSITAGSVLVLADPRTSGPSLVKALISHRATILPAVAPMVDNLAVLVRKRIENLDRLRLITNTGAAMSQATLDRIRTHMPNVRFQLMYGLTECKRAAINPPDGDIERPGSCGLPLPGTRIRIVDEDLNDLPAGQVGQIVVTGPNVMSGYWQEAELTAERFHVRNATQRELLSGDYGWLDDAGYLYFSDRKDDIFKQKGFRVSCSEVEAAANQLEGVSSAVLIPPHGRNPSVLFLCGRDDTDEILPRLKEELEEYKLPGRCVALPDMPITPNGKFDRKRLKQLSLR